MTQDVTVGGMPVVPGVKVRMTAAELATHRRARAEHHRGRAAAKAKEKPELKRVLDAIKPKPDESASVAMSKVVSNSYHMQEDQVEALERDIRDHEAKAFNFDWLAGHLFDVAYCLDQADLTRLEITKQ